MTDAIKNPALSIICPIRNVAKYIAETIDSVLAQSYKDWELIVMDGASTDGTVDIVKRYAALHPNIRLVSERDESSWHAFDKGLALARGEFIATICGQDGFLDTEWLFKAMRTLENDPTVALVWATSREMSEDGRLLPGAEATYTHLMKGDSWWSVVSYVIKKIFRVIRDLLFGSTERRSLLVQRLFSKTARMRFNLLTHRSFPEGKAPQKESWFWYWLETGFPFTDQAMIVSKKVYEECAAHYPMGSRLVNHLTDFNYNFNSRGYLSAYIPVFAIFGRTHPGNSGDVRAGELQAEFEKYLRNILALRAQIKRGQARIVFRDRSGAPLSSPRAA